MTEISLPSWKSENETLYMVKTVQSVDKVNIKPSDKKFYQSGAWYIGDLVGTQRCGWGQFKWLNGGFYEGNHVRNKRDGRGKYVWNDGTIYTGDFKNDLRHGYGELKWMNGETYKGDFDDDMRHGFGIYTWPDGRRYEGNFHKNMKCGYGKYTMANGDLFEGTYKDDVRCGPGILTYKNINQQDVGIWKSSTLARICTSLNSAFLYSNFPHHNINAAAFTAKNRNSNLNSSTKQCESAHSNSRNNEEVSPHEHYCIDGMPSSFPYSEILAGNRDMCSAKGQIEQLSEKLLHLCGTGNLSTVEKILNHEYINPNVADSTGYFPIMAAAVNCHIDVLNCLLDHGANINLLTNEGLSALSACHVLLNTEQNFIVNIAENIPDENCFNTIEIDRRTGTVINRNERKMILAIYEAIHKPLASVKKQTTKYVKPSNKSFIPSGSFITNGSTRCSAAKTWASIEDEIDPVYDQWKLDYYQRSMNRVKEVQEINRTFKEFMLNPQIEKDDCLSVSPDDLQLPVRNLDFSLESDKLQMHTTEASNYGYDCNSMGSHPTLVSSSSQNSISSNKTMKNLLNMERKPHLQHTIQLLLKRGANPNSSELPMPVLFFAVKSIDPEAVKDLLQRKADSSLRMKTLNLSALHISVALPSPESITITKLLLQYGADPNLRDGYLDGRTSLHIVCCRDDDYKKCQKIAKSLLEHHADPDLLCAGNSALSLAISSGNDLVIDTLLKFKANTSLKLTHGHGSALCVAVSFQAERHRSPSERMKLIEKLILHGADILTPVRISDKYPPGTVVDYAHHVFSQDRRIACTPYHALSSIERECFNARREMLDKLGDFLRTAALRKEEETLKDFSTTTILEASMKSINGNNSSQHTRKRSKQQSTTDYGRDDSCGLRSVLIKVGPNEGLGYIRKLRYCYECGRSIGVRLSPCTRCKEVFYCSKNCKVKAWNLRHRTECSKVSGQNLGSDPQCDSPTPTAEPQLTGQRTRANTINGTKTQGINNQSLLHLKRSNTDLPKFVNTRFLPQL